MNGIGFHLRVDEGPGFWRLCEQHANKLELLGIFSIASGADANLELYPLPAKDSYVMAFGPKDAIM